MLFESPEPITLRNKNAAQNVVNFSSPSLSRVFISGTVARNIYSTAVSKKTVFFSVPNGVLFAVLTTSY